jgi:hypothetical protein
MITLRIESPEAETTSAALTSVREMIKVLHDFDRKSTVTDPDEVLSCGNGNYFEGFLAAYWECEFDGIDRALADRGLTYLMGAVLVNRWGARWAAVRRESGQSPAVVLPDWRGPVCIVLEPDWIRENVEVDDGGNPEPPKYDEYVSEFLNLLTGYETTKAALLDALRSKCRCVAGDA